jgi:Ras-related protein Rab-2A
MESQLISYAQYIEKQNMAYDYVFKCIIVGDSGVGKSSLLLQFTENKFVFDHDMTIGVEFGSKTIDINGKTIKLQIWDTAGQESFRSIVRSYYRDTGLVLLVYDVSNSRSFTSLNKWLEDIKDMANSPHIILVGNKSDLSGRRQISTDDGKLFADKNHLMFIETSARNINTVNDAFVSVAKQTLESIQKGEIDIFDTSRGIRQGLLVKSNIINLSTPHPAPTGSGYCC